MFFEDFLLVCFKMYGFLIEDLILFKFEKLGLYIILYNIKYVIICNFFDKIRVDLIFFEID